jgi:OOP family OmpA-OmpF porin
VAPPPPKPDSACQRALDTAALTGRIFFATGRADVLEDSEAKLRAIVAALADCPDARVEVGGHTDNVGERPANLELSLWRAVAVVDWLANAGVARERMNAAGYGPDHPVAPNDSDDGRAQNRRIDFVILP